MGCAYQISLKASASNLDSSSITSTAAAAAAAAMATASFGPRRFEGYLGRTPV